MEWLNDGYNGFYPESDDWETHLTTLFPEVRPKGFFELRGIDSQAAAWWAVPAILTTAILYDDKVMEKIESLLFPHHDNLDKMLCQAANKGIKAFPELCEDVFRAALNTDHTVIDEHLIEYMERFFLHYTFNGLNPADELLAINNKQVFLSFQYLDYESRLKDIALPPSEVDLETVSYGSLSNRSLAPIDEELICNNSCLS